MTVSSPVKIRREGRVWNAPLNIRYTARDMWWRIEEPLREGDELLLSPKLKFQATFEIGLSVTPVLVCARLVHWSVDAPPVRVVFGGMTLCPDCDSYVMHRVEVPEIRQFVRRTVYLLRTCAVCGVAWEQEVD